MNAALTNIEEGGYFVSVFCWGSQAGKTAVIKEVSMTMWWHCSVC